MIKLYPNGDIFVRGVLAATDKDVVDGLREYVLTVKNSKISHHDVDKFYKD